VEDVKLPDLSRVRDAKQRSKVLPPQKSATDTSNWEDRHISAPSINTERDFHFIMPTEMPPLNPYLLQEARKAQYRTKKTAS
jgi:hypothetical protein